MKTTSFAIDPVDTAAESDMETQPRAVRQSRQREKIDEIVDKVVGKDLEWLNKKLISPGDPEYIRCVNQKDKYESYTPLLWAAKQGLADVVEVLCKCSEVDKNMPGGWNETTPLMKASERSYDEVVSVLIKNKANLNKQNQYGMTALMLASEVGCEQSVKHLALGGADPNIHNKDGYTALILAAAAGKSHACEKLVKIPDVLIDDKNKFGKSALIMACENGHLPCVKILAENKADVNFVSARGLSGLMLACVKGHMEVVKFLTITAGANVLFKTHSTALSMACAGGHEKIVDHLISIEPNVCKDVMLALMNACGKGNVAIINKLIQGNAVTEETLRHQSPIGNTCLMEACQKGHIDVVITLLDRISSLQGSKYSGIGSLNDSDIWTISNQEGHTALTLLSHYYRDHDESEFAKFLGKAIEQNRERPFLLDMLPSILPACKSPNTLMNRTKDDLVNGLKHLRGYSADIQLVGALTNIAVALKLSAQAHQVESRDLMALVDEFEEMLAEVMNSPSMDYPENVTKVLRRRDNKDSKAPEIVSKALTFLHGPLHDCVKYDLTKILATAQIITHVNGIFFSSLKSHRISIIRTLPDLFQLRSGCSTCRYSPVVMFVYEACYKVCLLVCVGTVAMSIDSSTGTCNVREASWLSVTEGSLIYWEIGVALMLITSSIYELGEIINKAPRSVGAYNTAVNTVRSFRDHLSDRWNVIDIITLSLMSRWFHLRFFTEGNDEVAHAWLSSASIPLSLGLLRFQSMFKQTGQLVIMVFEMANDLGSFIVIFLTCLLGYGITFHSLFPHMEGSNFSTLGGTFLTLFDAALGNHDFDTFASTPKHKMVGIWLMILYITLVMIVLLNLIIARMSATHEKIDSSALEVWSKIQAINVEEFVLIYERSSMCMLPPPLNIMSIGVSVYCQINCCVRKVISTMYRLLSGSVGDIIRFFSLHTYAGLPDKVDSPEKKQKSVTEPRLKKYGSSRRNSLVDPAAVAAATAVTPKSVSYSCPGDVSGYYGVAAGVQPEENVLSLPGIVSDKVTSILSAPVFAIFEVVLANYAIWSSSAPRLVPTMVSFLSVLLFPVAVVFFYIMSLWSISVQEFTKIHKSDGRIEFVKSGTHAFRVSEETCVALFQASHTIVHLVMNFLPLAKGTRLFYTAVLNISMIMAILLMDPALNKQSQISRIVEKGHLKALEKYARQIMESKILKRFISTPGKLHDDHVKFNLTFSIKGLIFGLAPVLVIPLEYIWMYETAIFLVLVYVYYRRCEGDEDHQLFHVDEGERGRASSKSPTMWAQPVVKRHDVMRVTRQLSARKPSGNLSNVISPLGTLKINLIRGNLPSNGESFFGRKVNPYVIITYGENLSVKSKAVSRGGCTPQWNETFHIQLTENVHELLFEVFDQDDMEGDEIIHDEFLCHQRLDIREWIANRRFEGNFKMLDMLDQKSANTLQLDVKVLYPPFDKESKSRSGTVSGKDGLSTPHSAPLKEGSFFGAGVDPLDDIELHEDAQLEIEMDPLFSDKDRNRIFKTATHKERYHEHHTHHTMLRTFSGMSNASNLERSSRSPSISGHAPLSFPHMHPNNNMHMQQQYGDNTYIIDCLHKLMAERDIVDEKGKTFSRKPSFEGPLPHTDAKPRNRVFGGSSGGVKSVMKASPRQPVGFVANGNDGTNSRRGSAGDLSNRGRAPSSSASGVAETNTPPKGRTLSLLKRMKKKNNSVAETSDSDVKSETSEVSDRSGTSTGSHASSSSQNTKERRRSSDGSIAGMFLNALRYES